MNIRVVCVWGGVLVELILETKRVADGEEVSLS